MPVRPEPGIGQGGLYVPEVVKAPELPEGFDLDRRVSFSHMIKVIGQVMALPPDYTTQAEVEQIEPINVDRGLHFAPREAFRLGLTDVYQGVVFPSGQFLDIARSPSDLAKHKYSRAKNANKERPPEERLNRDDEHDTASRSAGHVLENHNLKLTAMKGILAGQLLELNWLHTVLRAPGRSNWSARRLDAIRRTASDIFAGHVELAAGTHGWNDHTTDERQQALHYNLYGHNGHNNRRLGHWMGYVMMSGRHTRRQLNVADFSLNRVNEELVKYQPYLDAKRDDA